MALKWLFEEPFTNMASKLDIGRVPHKYGSKTGHWKSPAPIWL